MVTAICILKQRVKCVALLILHELLCALRDAGRKVSLRLRLSYITSWAKQIGVHLRNKQWIALVKNLFNTTSDPLSVLCSRVVQALVDWGCEEKLLLWWLVFLCHLYMNLLVDHLATFVADLWCVSLVVLYLGHDLL